MDLGRLPSEIHWQCGLLLTRMSLARQPGYLETALEWSEHATMAEELLQFLPTFLAP